MKIKKFCATATLLAAACAMQAGAMAADTPTAAATAGTATQSTVGTAVTATNQTASTDAATGELLPSDVQTSSDGLQLKKIYDVGKTTSPDKIPQADFERGGFKYTFEDLLKIELPEMDRKVHSETVTVSSAAITPMMCCRCCRKANPSAQQTVIPAQPISIFPVYQPRLQARKAYQTI